MAAEANPTTSNTVDQNSSPTTSAEYRVDKWSMFKTFVFRMLFTYFIFSMFRRSPSPPTEKSVDGKLPTFSPGASTNMYLKNDLIDLYAYLSESPETPDLKNQSKLFWLLKDIPYGDWQAGENNDGSYSVSKTIKASEALMNNGSMFLHVYIVKSGFSPDPDTEDKFSKQYTFYASKMITKYKKRRIYRSVNLLTGTTETPTDLIASPDLSADVNFLPQSTHWHPNLTINILDDHTNWVQGSIPAPISEHIRFYPPTNQYYPPIFFNDFWNLNEDYLPVNSTTPNLELRLTFQPITLFKWQIYLAQTMRKSWFSGMLGETESDQVSDDAEQDTFKKTLLETSPYLLAITVLVSIAHSIFELLAFKNDIQFWKSRESFEGLSVRSVFFNIFYSAVVVLYVLDNDTNFVIKVSVVIALVIEIWKVKKVVGIKIDPSRKLFGSLPYPMLNWQSSYIKSDTKKYDQIAFKYLSWVFYPLLVIYAAYSLIYEEHKGWYSWILSMLYGFFLTFGFIAMTPQLFINYKLKSVAHLPWRMLSYKALNTFIDDLFAFVIRTPTLYRIGCLRDDVIFFVYLYQRWIYPTDPKRVNEFGTSQEMMDHKKTDGDKAIAVDDKREGEEVEERPTAEVISKEDTSNDEEIRRRRNEVLTSS